MCNYYLLNELALGNRSLGFEFVSISDKKSEVVEMTAKTVKDNIKAGKKIHGLQIAENGEDLILDEKFFMKNYTVKTHINNIRPKYDYDGQCVANLMYIVVGSHEENGKRVYDVISSRVERTTFTEEKLKAMYDLGFISGGCKVEDGKVILPTSDTKPSMEEPKVVVPVEEKKAESKVEETVKVEVKVYEPTKPAEPKKAPAPTKSETKPESKTIKK